MVVFTCNNCGDSLQKPKVAKHYQFQCRNPIFLTCVDCFKDFRGDEYVAHTKCITENERYGGKNYTPKQSTNKGERKQQAWLNIVQNVLTNSTYLTVPERNLLNSISKHENIPRKKAKFFNFIKSLSGNRVNMAIVESVWTKMENAFKEATADSNTSISSTKNENGDIEESQKDLNLHKDNDVENSNISKNKKKKKSNKRQHEIDENESQLNIKKRNENKQIDSTKEEIVSENGVNKFNWKRIIFEFVSEKGEISLKKLRKKVIAQYLDNFPDSTSEKATSKFEKKFKKVSNILIDENKVRLASS